MEPNNSPAASGPESMGPAVEVMDAPAPMPEATPLDAFQSENESLRGEIANDEAQADQLLGGLLEGTSVTRESVPEFSDYAIGEGGAGVDNLLGNIESSGNEVFGEAAAPEVVGNRTPDAIEEVSSEAKNATGDAESEAEKQVSANLDSLEAPNNENGETITASIEDAEETIASEKEDQEIGNARAAVIEGNDPALRREFEPANNPVMESEIIGAPIDTLEHEVPDSEAEIKNEIESTESRTALETKEINELYPDTTAYLLEAKEPAEVLEAFASMDEQTLLKAIEAIEYGTPEDLDMIMNDSKEASMQNTSAENARESWKDVPHHAELEKILAQLPESQKQSYAFASPENSFETPEREELRKAFKLQFGGAVLYHRNPEEALVDTKIMLVNHEGTWQLPASVIRTDENPQAEVQKMLAFQTGVMPEKIESVLQTREVEADTPGGAPKIQPEYFLAKAETDALPNPENTKIEAKWFTLGDLVSNPSIVPSYHDKELIAKAMEAVKEGVQ